MKSIEEYLNDTVKNKSEYSRDFKELLSKYKQGNCVRVFVESVIEEAIKEYAKQIAIEQRQACGDVVWSGYTDSEDVYNVALVTDTK